MAEGLDEVLPGGKGDGGGAQGYKCPPAPLEFILLLDDHLRQRGLREQVELHYFSPVAELFPMKHIARIVQPLFEARGIRFTVDFNLKEIGKDAVHAYEGGSLPFDLAVVVPPHGVAGAIAAAGLARRKWVVVDRRTLKVAGEENVFALGH